MANTGKFYPFNRYINDIALLMDGSHKIIPSKYILLSKLKNENATYTGDLEGPGASSTNSYTPPRDPVGGDVIGPGVLPGDNYSQLVTWEWPDDVVREVNKIFNQNNAQSLEEINYQVARKKTLEFLQYASEPNNHDNDNNIDYYIGGDINFISHDVYDGMLYSEIYLHVPNDAGQYRIRVNNTNQEQYERVLTEQEPYDNGETNTYSFQGVLMFYNIYKTGSDEPFACDIPLGVFVLLDDETENGIGTQELIISTDELLGNGTAWSTRICSRFVSSAAIKDDPSITTGQSDYSTLSALLSEFGKSIKIMEKNISSREEDILTIKSYLDDFKHYQTINVPYVLGDWWYVNGRPIKPIDELELLIAQGNQFSWTTTLDMTWPNDEINEELNTVTHSTSIIEYINIKGVDAGGGNSALKKFLLLCARKSQNGRFEGTNGVVCIDVVNKILTVECKMADQASKTFRAFDIEIEQTDGEESINFENEETQTKILILINNGQS